MRKAPLLTILLFCVGCWSDDKCLSPDCEHSTEFRFNLVDASGADVIFDGTNQYEVSDIAVVDQQGVEYQIVSAKITSVDEVLLVDLNGHVNHYDLLLDGEKKDSFTVNFRETNEECCGHTYWIDNIRFNSLQTYFPSNDVGSLHIKIN
ncbi:hypothetical protein D770_22075 [Flammeovirgaceae bacterium 311]|nr:hypothetical protein D770_22075 [Flammeovirgaceae bacterium 311]